LLVEDEPLVAMMLEDVLGEAGYAVVGPIAELGAALAAAQAEAVDLALLDVNLMGKHVYPAAAALAARGIPFIFMTGYGDGSLPADYADRPSVSKPYKVKTLLDALAALQAKQHDAG
jgi:DNA-binding response OmpR family regulator